jgi:hypothetical protein
MLKKLKFNIESIFAVVWKKRWKTIMFIIYMKLSAQIPGI